MGGPATLDMGALLAVTHREELECYETLHALDRFLEPSSRVPEPTFVICNGRRLLKLTAGNLVVYLKARCCVGVNRFNKR
jgi:predicted protein tyrosine phosphatase